MRRFFIFLFRLLNILLILLTLLSYLSIYVSPATTWVFQIITNANPLLLLANVLFVIFWAVQRNKFAFYSLCCLLLGWSSITKIIGVQMNTVAATASNDITILSYNAIDLYQRDMSDVEVQKAVETTFFQRDMRPDIICLQEMRWRRSAKIIKQHVGMPYAEMDGTGRLRIHSRYPMKNIQDKTFPHTKNGYLQADINVNGEIVRVVNVHLQSSRISDATTSIDQNDLREKETWAGYKNVLKQYYRTSIKRAKQITELMDMIAESPYPVILCGDLNEVPTTWHYQQIVQRGFTDNFREVGKGYGATYAGNLPALRIDYIFSEAAHFTPLAHQIWKNIPYSDHYPVVSRLRLKE